MKSMSFTLWGVVQRLDNFWVMLKLNAYKYEIEACLVRFLFFKIVIYNCY